MSSSEVPSLEKLLSLKLSELKKAVKAKSLSTTGTKAELAERLRLFHVTEAEEARLLANEPNEAELLGEIDDVTETSPPAVDSSPKAVAPTTEPPAKAKAGKTQKVVKTATKRKAAAPKPAAAAVISPVVETLEPEIETSPEGNVQESNDTVEVTAPSSSDVQVEGASAIKSPISTLSEEERKRLRAERFSTHLSSTDEDMEARKRARAERFGLPYTPPKTTTSRGASDVSSASLEPEDLKRMEKRAARFGEVVAPSLRGIREEKTKAKRMERFGIEQKTSGSGQSDEEKRKRRMERFGTSDVASKALSGNSDEEERKKRRLERFGGAAAGAEKTGGVSEAMLKRAKRFGVVSEDEKKAARALRFGVSA